MTALKTSKPAIKAAVSKLSAAPSPASAVKPQIATLATSHIVAAASVQVATSPAPVTRGLLPVAPSAVTMSSMVLTVGAGAEYTTLAAAVAASHDGDTILVAAGTYTNDLATITTKLTIEGVGGMAKFVATEPPPNLKGILTVDDDVTIENLSFSGAAIDAGDGGNGAGIRYEGGQMALENDTFSNNQDGILAFPVIASLTTNTISVDHCVFSDNGSGSGYTHNLYVGAVASLTATNSVFEGAVVGHEFKSRALANTIENNLFYDGPTGTASYDIDLPDGGVDLVKGNTIEKGPLAENDAMVHFGGEGIPYAGSSLTIADNDFVNDKGAATVALLNQTAVSATIDDNTFDQIAAAQIAQGPATGSGNVDGNGKPLPNINLVGVLPGNTTVFTDAAPHTVTLSNSGEAVEGGGGLLTVIDPAGHIVAIGGSGGMDFVEEAGAGGSSITTKAGSVNAITLVGQDEIDSEGSDTIHAGPCNITGKLAGNATVFDGTGGNQWTLTGTATITGQGGSPEIAVGAGANLTVNGSVSYLQVQNNGGTVQANVTQGGATESASITGGAATLSVYNSEVIIATAAGPNGATLRLGSGTAQITSAGADVIYAGSGTENVIVSANATIYAGTGALTLFGHGDQLGATLNGNGGSYVLDGDTGNITYQGGALASTVTAKLSNNTLVGGAGHLTILGGSRETITGGKGGITYSAADGGGDNTITTAAGAIDVLTLAGGDVVSSHGNDNIYEGFGNQTLAVFGTATLHGSTGNSSLDLFGRALLIGVGQDACTVNAGALLTVYAGVLTRATETSGTVMFGIYGGANAVSLSVVGGGAQVQGGSVSAATVVTAQGQSTAVTLKSGTAAVTLNGQDTVHAGAGSDTIQIDVANTTLWGGSGSLAVNDADGTNGDAQTIHGGSGSLTYSQGGGALTFIGGSGSAVINGNWGSLSVVGGSGNLTMTGGQGGVHFVAGSGNTNIALTASGGDVTFGAGDTSVQAGPWGPAEIFRCIAGSGGGSDQITGFRLGTDQLVFQGVSVASETLVGGSTNLLLTDNTQLQLIGVGDTNHIY